MKPKTKTHIFYNSTPDAYDGLGYYLWINSISRTFGPYDSYIEALEAEIEYLENFLESYELET